MTNLLINTYVFFTDLRNTNLYRITDIQGDNATLYFTDTCKLSELSPASIDQLRDNGIIPSVSAKARSFNSDMGWS